jgi:hypothetical protein
VRPVDIDLADAFSDDFADDDTTTLGAGEHGGLDDPTEVIGGPVQERRSVVRPPLPSASAVFERTADDLRVLTGLERRLVELADGITPIADLVQELGVNLLRAQHLAARAEARGLVRRVALFDGLDDLGLADDDDPGP